MKTRLRSPASQTGGGILAILCSVGMSTMFFDAHAQTLPTGGCPLYHCTPEATGVIQAALVQQPTTVKSNNMLGDLRFQGCSGNGQRLACLYANDATADLGRGTLKVLDASTLTPIWGSAAAGSIDLAAKDTTGQLPLIFADGRIAAGDAAREVLYASDGAVLASAPLTGSGNNFGLTPISATRGVVSQNDGVLTLIDLATWQVLDVLALRDPFGNGKPSLVSPSSGTAGTLYAVGVNGKTNRGLLFAVTLDAASQRLVQRSTFAFSGRSGASPVVVAPAISGLSTALVLLHTPGLDGDTQNRMVGLRDDGVALSPMWSLALSAPLVVTPAIDPGTQTFFFAYKDDKVLRQNSVLSGAPVRSYDLQAMSGLPQIFGLNGHLVSTYGGGSYTLLLSASVSRAPESNGQYAIAFTPTATPNSLLWVRKISGRADSYTAAWNVAPSAVAGVACPIVVGTGSGLTRVCDF